jgi:prepilin-type N-terminal cleavage/methylation domain-containing protein
MKRTSIKHNQGGFTIIELMISTMVFGVILLVITTAILQISRLYYKGVTQAKTQSVARSTIDLISQGIQFSGGDVTETPGTYNAFCVGNQQYSFALGKQIVEPGATRGTNQDYHALVVDDKAGCTSSSTAVDMSNGSLSSGRELLEPKMRLAKMSVQNIGEDLYRVSLKVVFGDDDVLNNPAGANATCKNITAGTQFCAVSELTTVVTKRVE